MAGMWNQWKNSGRKARTTSYDANNQRSDLHPRVRYLLHRQSKSVYGTFTPFIIGFGFACTALLYYVPQEKNTADRIKNLMESTLDEIDILENKKSQFAQQLDNLKQKAQSQT